MSTLAAFSGTGLGGMLAEPKQTVQPATPPSSSPDDKFYTPVGHPRHGQRFGSRQRRDGSWELLTGADISSGSDHTETCGNSSDDRAITHDPSPMGCENLDAISDKIETLRDQVKQLRDQEFEMLKSMPKSSYSGGKIATAASISLQGGRSKIPAPSQSLQKLATAHPQHTHGNKQLGSPDVLEGKAARKESDRGKSSRKAPPAAPAALTGSQSMPGGAPNQAVPRDQKANKASVSPHDGLSSGSPHFAQPTIAAAIRHESVRRDSACQQAKAVPEGSTRSSIHQGVHKRNRKSLPGGWTNPAVDEKSAEVSGPDSISIPSDELRVNSRTEHVDDRKAVSQDQSPRKKSSSSYMSPTKATALRNIATIGQENTKRISPRISCSRPLSQIHTAFPPAGGMISAGSITSDSGSETIITEMTIKDAPVGWTLVTPTQPARYTSPNNRSPTGVIPSDLRRRMTVGVSVADVLAQHARSSAFLGVAHTTRKRRETTGDLLNPIKARLNKVGLLNVSGSIYTSESSVSSPLSMTMHSPLRGAMNTPENVVEPGKSIVESGESSVESRHVFEPPHRRILDARAAAAALAPSAASQPGDNSHMPMPPPTLRATAAEFRPTTKSPSSDIAPATSFTSIDDWDTALMFRSADQWANLSPDDKRRIQVARHFQRTGGEIPGTQLARQAHWQTVVLQPVATQPGPVPTYAEVYGTDVVAGQKLRPYPIPVTNGLQWIVQDTNCEETPISFRGGTPSPTPRPFNNLPRRVPMTPPDSWTIGADASNQNTFGWTSGAGREIKFVGYGPDAERDPNTPVSFNFRGGNTSSGRNEYGPRMIGQENYDGSPEPPLAPRSKAQWAKLKGYTHVPCSHFDITHGVEVLPIPGFERLTGYCNDCADSAH